MNGMRKEIGGVIKVVQRKLRNVYERGRLSESIECMRKRERIRKGV